MQTLPVHFTIQQPRAMNSENFHEYLKNPSKLHQISYQELKSLVLQYPFSPNLRYLLMVKSLFDQNKEYDRNLTLAAMYTPDRKKLWKLVKQNSRLKEIKENYELNEEFLELKDLSALEEMIENQSLDAVDEAGLKEMKLVDDGLMFEHFPAEKSEDSSGKKFEDDEDLDFLEELLDEPGEETGNTPLPELQLTEDSGERKEDKLDTSHAADEPEEEPASFEELLDQADSTEEDSSEEIPDLDTLENIAAAEMPEEPAQATPDEEAEVPDETLPATATETPPVPEQNDAPAPAPLPKAAFRSWRKDSKPAKAGLLSGSLKKVVVHKKMDYEEPEDDFEDDYPEEEAQHIAAQSVKEDAEIASETLALVLEKQEHYEKAIAMYERLLLQNPEKSSFFAAKIQNLKNKL